MRKLRLEKVKLPQKHINRKLNCQDLNPFLFDHTTLDHYTKLNPFRNMNLNIHKFSWSCHTEFSFQPQFSCSVMSDSLRPHELQHARPPFPSPTPRIHWTHIHRVRDAIQPSHPLSSPSPPVPNPSQHQSLFQRVNSSHEVAKVLEFQL